MMIKGPIFPQGWFRAEDEDEDDERPAKAEKDGPSSDIAKRLYEARVVMICGEINQRLAQVVSAQLLTLAHTSSDPIRLFINSQGGHVEAGDTIFDMIRFVKAPVHIVGTGWVASAGALIYASVPVARRYSLPNTRFMLHQPMGGVRGQASDISIEAEEILKMRARLNQIFADATGQPLERIEHDTERNFWMGPDQAKEYGLVGRIVQHERELA
jgi:ATP-dependent Clp protease, protease subunit